MSDDKQKRLTGLQEKLDAHERELRQSLQKEVHRQSERNAAITLGARIAMFGSIPSILWTIFSHYPKGWSGEFELLIGPLCFVIPVVIVAAAAGVISGFFAACWFTDSLIPVPRAVICMALLSDAALFCWVVVLSR